MPKPFKRFISFLAQPTFLCQSVLVCLCSMGLMSCDNDTNKAATAASDNASTETNQPIIGREMIQIGTDLDINSLQPLSKVYSARTGVKIEWIPIETPFNQNHPSMAKDSGVNHNDGQQYNNEDRYGNSAFDSATSLTLPQGLDMLLVHSAYTMYAASQAHQLQPLGSDTLIQAIPKQYQDPKGEWYGLSKYARTIVYNKNNVNEPELINYAGLADNKWFGRLCMTPIEQPENQAIAKMMWTYRGSTKTPEILLSWLTNMGYPMPDDSHVLTQIEKGHCDVGVIDSDMFWRYAKANPSTSIRLMWTNQINRGTMTNTLTAGAVKNGDAVGAALDFMEWLVSDEGQALLAFNTSTFPVTTMTDEKINLHAIRPDWTQFESDDTPLVDIMADRRVIEPQPPEPEPVP